MPVDSQKTLLSAQANRLLADIYRMQGKYDQALARLQAASNAFDALENASGETSTTRDESTQVRWFPGRSFSVATNAKELDKMPLQEGRRQAHAPTPLSESLLLKHGKRRKRTTMHASNRLCCRLRQSYNSAVATGVRPSSFSRRVSRQHLRLNGLPVRWPSMVTFWR